MKKYIIMVFVFLGLVLGFSNALAEEVTFNNDSALLVDEVSKIKTSFSISEITNLYDDEYLNAKEDSANLAATIKTSEDKKFDRIFWQITNGSSTLLLECKITYKSSGLPVLTDSYVEDKKPTATVGGCSVDWLLGLDGEYTITAKSFIDLENRAKVSVYESVKKFVINTKGDIQAEITVKVDRTVPIITPNSGPESIVRGETYVDPGATVKKGDLIVDDNLKGVNEIDTSSVGSKVITYEYTDEAGNEATAERTVIVENPTRRSSSSGSYIGRVTPTQNIVVPPATGEVLGAESFFFTLLLKLGSSGAEVVELQKFLNLKGFDSGLADGKFGPKTKASVIRFQLANNLVGDGIVGPLTRAVLNK